MSLRENLQQQMGLLRKLDRDAWLFLSVTVMNSIFFSAWGLYFNFFFLAQGFSRSWLGMFSGAAPASSLVFGIAMGMVSDKIGQKRAMTIGLGGFLVGMFIAVISRNAYAIMATIFFGGALDAMYVVNRLPLMARLTTKENKSFLFSLNFGLMTFAGMLGSLIAGYLPEWYQRWFNVTTGSVENYQYIMLTSVLLATLSFIPLSLMRVPKKKRAAGEDETEEDEQTSIWDVFRQPITWKIFMPNFFIGMGAALLVPFLNLYLVDKFAMTERSLGMLFSAAGLMTGVGTLLSPTLERALGSRIKAVVLAQGSSLLFLLILGFGPTLGLAIVGFLMRGALMNMGVPLWDSFAMDQVPENQQATISSLLFIAWQIGWSVGPTISGMVQERYGFTPLFITTGILYATAISWTWITFGKVEEPQFESALAAGMD